MRPIDRSLLQIFSSEQAEHIGCVRDLLAAISRSEAPVDPTVFDELLRRAHTLKGASANIHAHRLSAAASHLESAARAKSLREIDGLVREVKENLRAVSAQLREVG